jgi:hypothetical protein
MHLNRQPLTNSTHPHPSHARLALYAYALNALPAGTQFTCFTSTKVRILRAPAPVESAARVSGWHLLALLVQKYGYCAHPSHTRRTLSGYYTLAKRSPFRRWRRPIYLLY